MRGGKRWNRNQFLILSNIKKSLPAELQSQNRGLAHYALKCLGTIYLAALRPHFRAFLPLQPGFRDFFVLDLIEN